MEHVRELYDLMGFVCSSVSQNCRESIFISYLVSREKKNVMVLRKSKPTICFHSNLVGKELLTA